MSQLIAIQTSPRTPGTPCILVEGKPAVALDVDAEIVSGIPSVLVEGKPIAVSGPGLDGATTVLAGESGTTGPGSRFYSHSIVAGGFELMS